MSEILEFADDFIFVRYVCNEPGLCADGGTSVRPGESYEGFTYEDLRAMGPGRHDLSKHTKPKRYPDASG